MPYCERARSFVGHDPHGDVANGIRSNMVEVNKALFMDTATFRRTEGFTAVQKGIDTVVSETRAGA